MASNRLAPFPKRVNNEILEFRRLRSPDRFGELVIYCGAPGGTTWWDHVAAGFVASWFIFVARDFAQRELVIGFGPHGHRGDAQLFHGVSAGGIGKCDRILISELLDWAVYTYTKRPLSERILYSSVLGTPVDSIVFLSILGYFSIVGAAAMTASKLWGHLLFGG